MSWQVSHAGAARCTASVQFVAQAFVTPAHTSWGDGTLEARFFNQRLRARTRARRKSIGAKKVRVEFVDGSGQGVGGVTVKATGCSELQTAPTGQAFFLVDEENFAVTANGAEVYKGALSALPEKIVFKQDGGSWKAA